MRIFTAVAACAVTVGVLSGCSSGDSSSAYCDAVKDMGTVSTDPGSSSAEMVSKSRKIAEVAPDDIKSDWETYANSLEQINKNNASMTSTDLSDPTRGLADMRAKSEANAAAAGQLGTSAQKVTQHMDKTCKK
ncbi:hypothetical protein [Nocardia wallacei]|uniref:hypothetical protein n=1 Tax=Nocardia wallacei TaxID=480035 RepID=UPI002453C375|nr:hypothetical protein [Nocardia wallacei]